MCLDKNKILNPSNVLMSLTYVSIHVNIIFHLMYIEAFIYLMLKIPIALQYFHKILLTGCS